MALRGVTRAFGLNRKSAPVATVLAVGGAIALALAVGSLHPSAQEQTPEFQTGKNVDIIGPYGSAPYDPAGSNPFWLGDPDKKQQNEPSCDVSPTNPLVIFCGVNNYSAVDRTDIVGEPWVGPAFSIDGGLNWKSHLHPGFKPKDPAAQAPLVAPLGFDTAADPVIRLAPGIGLFTFIAFNRDGVGALFMGRWFERNIESGFPYGWKDTVLVAKGTGSPTEPGRFLDKPGKAVSLLPGTSTYDFTVPDPTPANPARTRIQKVPAGIVHIAYAVFTGNDQQSGTKIVYTRSTNYGDTWEPGMTLSEAQSINQAPDIAVDPATNRVVVVWRRFADPNLRQTDAIMYAISSDGGRSFAKADVAANICPFTQGTTAASFRTTTHPFVTFDGSAFHAVWAERQGTCDSSPSGYSRIVMSNLSLGGTARWSRPAPIDGTTHRGHEFMPAIVSAGNRILVSWLDTRNDVRTGGLYPDPDPDRHVNDYLFPTDPAKVRRRSADMYAAQAFSGQTPTFGPPKQVSRYLTGIFGDNPAPRELERNKLNARMFQSGKTPFHGDYTTAAAQRFVARDPIGQPGVWVSSAGVPGVQPVFHVAWTDNRLVKGNVSAQLVEDSSTVYTPPPISTASEQDPTTPRTGVCTVTTAGTRDQSVFSARITPGIVLVSASASKPTVYTDLSGSHGVLRSYSLIAQNTSLSAAGDKTIALELVPQASVQASFRKVTTESPTPLTTLTNIALRHRSSLARTVYVQAPLSIAQPVVKINLRDGAAGPIIASTFLNPNPSAPPLDDPLDPNQRIPSGDQIDSIELHTPDILYRSTSIGTPAIDDPAIDDPAIDDPAIDDPAIDDPAIDDPAIDDPAIDDPAIDDPAIDDPAIDDPAIDDPAIDDPAIDDASVSASNLSDGDTESGINTSGKKLTQITWKVALKGNTTTSMSSKVFINVSDDKLAAIKSAIASSGGKVQLLVSRRYRTTDIRAREGAPCAPVRVSNFQVVANVPDPVLTNSPAPPDLVNPTSSEPSFVVPPGGAVYLTLRIWGDTPGLNPNNIGVVVQSQPGPPASEPLDNDLPPDQTAPVLNLPPGFQVTTEAVGPDGATVTYNVSATDETDGALPAICSPAPGQLFPIGTTTVNCAVSDSAGNESTGSFSVVVADTVAPVLTVPSTVAAEATSAAGAAVTYSASATDLVTGAVTPTCSPASGATFALGDTTVTCSATDGTNTGTASFTVTIRDTTPPVVTVPSNTVAEATGSTGAIVTYSASELDAVQGSVTPTCSPASGTMFAAGVTTVTCSASDGTNTATATFTVSVRDTTAPTVIVPSNIVAEAASGAGAVVAFSASATDAVQGPLAATCTPASGTTFPLGVTTVVCSASDGTNTGQASFTVTVRDTTAPVITGTPANIAVFGGAGTVVTYTSPTATDSVSGARPVTCSPASGSTFPGGVTTVTCTAQDASGNTATTSFTVTVTLDAVGPTITINSVSPLLLWPPDGALVDVIITGVAADALSGLATVRWSVRDEYRQVEPSGSVVAAADGSFTIRIPLVRDRRGNDKDGRHYTITLIATDNVGNATPAAPIVVNVHDQSGS